MGTLPDRFGIGYDVHAFGRKRALILGGVMIPSERGLIGHSDADVLLHAICDALLGAAALGDIGTHFPNTRSKYKNISSVVLLKRVAGMLRRRRMRVANIDATILLERPKISRYVPHMRTTIAQALGINPSQVSVKATTNETMGFVGRGEGCAALAVASLSPR